MWPRATSPRGTPSHTSTVHSCERGDRRRQGAHLDVRDDHHAGCAPADGVVLYPVVKRHDPHTNTRLRRERLDGGSYRGAHRRRRARAHRARRRIDHKHMPRRHRRPGAVAVWSDKLDRPAAVTVNRHTTLPCTHTHTRRTPTRSPAVHHAAAATAVVICSVGPPRPFHRGTRDSLATRFKGWSTCIRPCPWPQAGYMQIPNLVVCSQVMWEPDAVTTPAECEEQVGTYSSSSGRCSWRARSSDIVPRAPHRLQRNAVRLGSLSTNRTKGLMYARQRVQRVGPSGPQSINGSGSSSGCPCASGVMIAANGKWLCVCTTERSTCESMKTAGWATCA